MNNIEAAYILIVAEADRRIKERKGDYCGKLVEVSQEIDEKILHLMKVTREKERENASKKNREDVR